jgi:hypothetical protein
MMIARHLLTVVLAVLPVAACSESRGPQPQETSSMKELMIPVEGMACGSCASRVKKTLTAIDGVGVSTNTLVEV